MTNDVEAATFRFLRISPDHLLCFIV